MVYNNYIIHYIMRERDWLLTKTGHCLHIPTPHPIQYPHYNIFVDYGRVTNEHVAVYT